MTFAGVATQFEHGESLLVAGLALSCVGAGVLFRPLKPTIVEVPIVNPVVMEPKAPENKPLLATEADANGRKMSLEVRPHAAKNGPTAEEVYQHLSGSLTPEPRSLSCHSLNTHVQYLKNGNLSPDAAENKSSAVSLRRPSLSAHLMDRDDRFFGGSLSRLPQYSSQVRSPIRARPSAFVCSHSGFQRMAVSVFDSKTTIPIMHENKIRINSARKSGFAT